MAPLIWEGSLKNHAPQYTHKEKEWALSSDCSLLPSGWLQNESGLLLLPAASQWKILKTLHQSFHFSIENTYQMTKALFTGKNLFKVIKQITRTCDICQRNNPLNHHLAPPGIQNHGRNPGEDWQMDFTHLSKVHGIQYILVFVDTFTNWVEAFPCRTEKPRKL